MTAVIWETLVSVFTIAGALLILFVAIRQFTTHDAVSRVNALGPMTALGVPFITIGAFLGWIYVEGFAWTILIKTLVTILASLFVSSVATSVLARAAYMSGAPLDPHTNPNHLAKAPCADDPGHRISDDPVEVDDPGPPPQR